MRILSSALGVTVLVALGMHGQSTSAAEISVMSGGAPQEVLTALTPQFEKQTGHKVK
jgi:ABC-type molybdate transport system substrate-binding protein